MQVRTFFFWLSELQSVEMAGVILGYACFLLSWSMKAFDDTLARVERFNQPQANAEQVVLIQKHEDSPELPHDQISL